MSRLTKKQAQAEVSRLREEISRHDHLYYAESNPEIPDADYDKFMRRLIELEQLYDLAVPDSPSQRVAGKVAEKFNPFTHKIPMMSIDNAVDEHETREFDKRIKRFLKTEEQIEYVLQPKFDGVSASLTYVEGNLLHGTTRGDGKTGEEVTANVKTIRSVPLVLSGRGLKPKLVEIRGEVIFPLSLFMELNEALKKRNKKLQKENKPLLKEREKPKPPKMLFKNPRNTASGSLRQLDSSVTALRPLHFYAWGVGGCDGADFRDELEIYEALRKWGFRVEEPKDCWGIDKAIKWARELEKKRGSFDYEIDGVVVKVGSRRLQEILGTTAKYPRWSVAIKFSPKQITTKVKDITVQVGRTGHLTPVAELEPVKISGIEIKRASLHTEDTVREKDVRVGDTVVVQRAGDVIPEVVEVVPSRERRKKHFSMSQTCPSCETPIKTEGSFHLCPNISCPAQIKGRISFFASRNAFDIEGLGEKRVEQLINEGFLRNIADIFTLKRDELIELEGFAEKSTDKLLEEIEKSKNISFDRFLNSLSIKHVGARTAQILAREFKTPEVFMETTIEDILRTKGIGQEMAQSIREFFKNTERKNLVEALLSNIEIDYPPIHIVEILKWLTKINRLLTRKAETLELLTGIARIEKWSLKINKPPTHKAETLQLLVDRAWMEEWFMRINEPLRRNTETLELLTGRTTMEEWFTKINKLLKSTTKMLESTSSGAKTLEPISGSAKTLESIANSAEALGSISRIAKALESISSSAKILESISRTTEALESTSRIAKALESTSDRSTTEENELFKTNERISGKIFVFTGRLSFPRDEIKKEIEKLGGTVTGSVSSKTDFLVSGADPGTAKLQKAGELGTDIINEEQLKKLIGL